PPSTPRHCCASCSRNTPERLNAWPAACATALAGPAWSATAGLSNADNWRRPENMLRLCAMSRNQEIRPDIDDGIDRKVLAQLRARFLKVNAGRLQRAMLA